MVLKNSLSNFISPWCSFPVEACSSARKSQEFGISFLFPLYEKFVLGITCGMLLYKRIAGFGSALEEVGNSFYHFSNSYTLKDEYYHCLTNAKSLVNKLRSSS